MSVRFLHRPKDVLGLLLFGGACGYGAFWLFTNDPNADGVMWAFALGILSALSIWGALRGYS